MALGVLARSKPQQWIKSLTRKELTKYFVQLLLGHTVLIFQLWEMECKIVLEIFQHSQRNCPLRDPQARATTDSFSQEEYSEELQLWVLPGSALIHPLISKKVDYKPSCVNCGYGLRPATVTLPHSQPLFLLFLVTLAYTVFLNLTFCSMWVPFLIS